METRTGRKLFCNCNDQWQKSLEWREMIELVDGNDEDEWCPVCGYFRWFYLNPNDEPKGDKNND